MSSTLLLTIPGLLSSCSPPSRPARQASLHSRLSGASAEVPPLLRLLTRLPSARHGWGCPVSCLTHSCGCARLVDRSRAGGGRGEKRGGCRKRAWEAPKRTVAGPLHTRRQGHVQSWGDKYRAQEAPPKGLRGLGEERTIVWQLA